MNEILRRFTGLAPDRVAALFGARATWRAAMLIANLVLLGVWGQPAYAGFAAEMGAVAFLGPLSSMGVEKSALKWIPRARGGVAGMLGVYLVMTAVLVVGAAAALIATSVLRDELNPQVALAGSLAIAAGANYVLVGLYRATDVPVADALNFAVLAVAVTGATAAVALLGASPIGFLVLLLGTTVSLDLVLIVRLRLDFSRLRDRSLVRRVVGTAALMAIPDVVGGIAVSLLFVVLGVAGLSAESSGLYLAFVASGLLLNGFAYLLRICQPRVSRAFERHDAADLVLRLRAWLVPLVWGGAAYVVLALVLSTTLLPSHGDVAVLAFYVACVPVIFGVATVNYVLENASSAALRATVLGALAGLAAVASLAWVLVPYAGALGAVTALVSGELVHATFVLRWLIAQPHDAPLGSQA